MKGKFISQLRYYKELKKEEEENERIFVYDFFADEEDDVPFGFWERFDDEMKEKLKKQDKLEELEIQEKKRLRRTLMKQAVAALIISLSLVSVWRISTFASPLSFIQFIIKDVDEHIISLIKTTEGDDRTTIAIDKPEYRLDGFELVSKDELDGNARIKYQNEVGKRYTLMAGVNLSKDVNIEEKEFIRKKINENQYFYSYNGDTTFLKWFMGDWIVSVSGNITLDEMVSIAELIQSSYTR